MAQWKLTKIDGTTEEIDAHVASVTSVGALVFANNHEDCHLRIIAPGMWSDVARLTSNPTGFRGS